MLRNPFMLVLFTFITCFSVSIIVALRGLPFEYWFTGSDLLYFSFLTGIYSGLVGIVSYRLRVTIQSHSIILRLGWALVGGGAFGIIWTIGAIGVMWPFVREIGLPLIDAWQVGGITGFIVSFVNVQTKDGSKSQGELPTRSQLFTSKWPSFLLSSIGFVIAYLAIYSISVSIYWNILVEKEVYLLPDSYQGPVLVVFNQSNGMPRMYEGRSRVYDVPETGILLTQFSPVKHAYTTEFLYIDAAGNRHNILFKTSCREKDLIEIQTVVACPIGFQSEPPTKGFVVGFPNQQEEYKQVLLDVLHDTLATLSP
jgi:hypothetical protein